MRPLSEQFDLFDAPAADVRKFIREVLASRRRPSPAELVAELDGQLGLKARWYLIKIIVEAIVANSELTKLDRDYLKSLIADDGLAKALRGEDAVEPKSSTIDELFKQSKVYQNSEKFRELIQFIGKFREYKPYNNMLVRVQNPSCSYYAREKDWRDRFSRSLKEDARPMLILAPKHPVMLVYDLDQTDGLPLPRELQEFAKFEGSWDPTWLSNAVENAAGHRIRVDFKSLSSTNAGFATLAGGDNGWKMRIAIHDGLDEPSRFGVLCHELAHVLLGHLGTDWDQWWPSRVSLDLRTIEIEAEAVAYIVSVRFGLRGSSAAYVSRHLKSGEVPSSVSLDYIAKVAGHIEEMAKRKMAPRRPRPPPKVKPKRSR